jgi:hypothetical protein
MPLTWYNKDIQSLGYVKNRKKTSEAKGDVNYIFDIGKVDSINKGIEYYNLMYIKNGDN